MSTLATYQRTMVSVAFAEDDTQRPVPGFELYREMIRARLFAMGRVAYPRSFDAGCFARYLADEPPASPFIRDVIASYGPYAEREASGLAASLLRFETAKWRVASLPYPPAEAGELDFAGRLVVNPTLLRVPLDYVVSEDDRPEAHILLMYRRPDDDGVLWSRLPRLATLLADEEPAKTLHQRVAGFFARGGDTADEAGLTRLADELTLAVERGIVLGSAS